MKTILLLVASLFVTAGCSSASSTGGGGGQTADGGGGAAGTGGSGAGQSTQSDGGAGSGGDQGSAGGSGGAAAAPTVHLAIDPTMMQAGDMVMATVDVTNFVLEAPEGQANQVGHGHYHIYLDQASGIDYLVANQVHTIPVQIPQGTGVGKHKLRVALGENDHAPLVPAVENIVDITVVAP